MKFWRENWAHREELIISELKTHHFVILDNFLTFRNDDAKNNFFHHISTLRDKNELIREESYMEDEETGQVTSISTNPFYTLQMTPKHFSDDEPIKNELTYFVETVGTWFQKLLFEKIFDSTNNNIMNEAHRAGNEKENTGNTSNAESKFFFNKVALCEDFNNDLPLHFDNYSNDSRKITVVYYCTPYREEENGENSNDLDMNGANKRNWTGGNLRIYKPSKHLYNNYWESEKLDIEPKFNRAVVFFSDTVVHGVTETLPNDSSDGYEQVPLKMSPPRTTITTWIHCNDMSRICEDKILHQRQMLKFFQP
ncbi:hypothetical protein C9374_008249 [Naegleria lovaniensis]|uniref:Prolyl 4-hydroxylase alpha subunit Fe(2+) 2OG dioxygenase domain-containing protein n=1 Tax=Naegleria lovaniensis TaxID=51637 RepID=A0AA88KGG1_NAELO|nr:uncharacterized protein C9374_008249 [Naegleria lovaniensis]KAG2378610.1 hypothetical protein C9374_008249 [Naegleria lovaniensis]